MLDADIRPKMHRKEVEFVAKHRGKLIEETLRKVASGQKKSLTPEHLQMVLECIAELHGLALMLVDHVGTDIPAAEFTMSPEVESLLESLTKDGRRVG